MKKYRRGSKIVDIVKRKFIHLTKNVKNIEQAPVAPSETKHNSHASEVEDPLASIKQSTSNRQHIHEQDESLETAQHDINPHIFQSASILPSTSAQSAKSNYDDIQVETFRHARPSSSMTLLDDDLYLTDSSDEYVPEHDETTTSSSEFSDHSTKHPTRRSVHNAKKNQIKKNINGLSEVSINTADSNVDSASGQQSRNRKRRQAVPNQWKKNIRKNKRQHGEPYLSAKGVLVPGKTLKESKCMGRCIHQCTSKFSEEERLKIFSSFWRLDNVEQKRLYIVDLIHRENTKTLKNKQSRKKLTNKYFLKKLGSTENIRVCQKFFLATLNVSETFVRFCLKKVIDSNNVVGDKRGKHAPHNKKSNDIREHVRNHIKSFPRMPPPRVRKDIKKEYLSRTLNLTRMYNLYRIKCDSEQRESVELAYYRSVFNKDFNIGFHRPGRDICDICVTFEQMNEEERYNEKQNHKEHLKRVATAGRHRDESKRLAQCGDIHFAEYDLKAICDCSSSSSKLKRSLPVYNFTVLDFNKDKHNVSCYCWHEGIARKGAAEIGSCLYKYLQNNADGKPVTFMSDTCASQCRNMYISSLLLYCIEIFDIPVINQKYFEQGHNEMETDHIHANIEKAKKDMLVHHPAGFYNIIRKSLGKYQNNVYEMATDDFIDIKYLKNILVKNAKVDCDGEPVNWLNIRWLQYRKSNPNHIYFKYDLRDKKFNHIQVIRRGKRLQNCEEIVLLKKSHEGRLPFTMGTYSMLPS